MRHLSLLVLLGLAAALAGCVPPSTTPPGRVTGPPPPRPAPEPEMAPTVGKPAPLFTLTDLDGEEFVLAEQKGKVVYLDFWATWCPPCREAMPHSNELAQRPEAEAGDLVVLAVDLDETPDEVTAYLEQQNFTMRTAIDPKGAAAEQYGVEGIPTFVVIGRDGVVKWQASGFNPAGTPAQIDAAIESALAEPAPEA